MLRILHLCAPTALAGAERVILNFLQSYNTSTFSVRLAVFLNYQRFKNSFTEALVEGGMPHDKISIGNTSLVWQVRQVINVIKQHSINILHTHSYRSDFVGLIVVRASGIPLVSTAVGGIPDIIRETKNGYLVSPGEEEQLATAMGKILHNYRLAKRIGQMA